VPAISAGAGAHGGTGPRLTYLLVGGRSLPEASEPQVPTQQYRAVALRI